MARYVFITGGVVSSLGKGLASAALGAVLLVGRNAGHSLRLRGCCGRRRRRGRSRAMNG